MVRASYLRSSGLLPMTIPTINLFAHFWLSLTCLSRSTGHQRQKRSRSPHRMRLLSSPSLILSLRLLQLHWLHCVPGLLPLLQHHERSFLHSPFSTRLFSSNNRTPTLLRGASHKHGLSCTVACASHKMAALPSRLRRGFIAIVSRSHFVFFRSVYILSLLSVHWYFAPPCRSVPPRARCCGCGCGRSANCYSYCCCCCC